MTFTERLIRAELANRWHLYRSCRHAPGMRAYARRGVRREIAMLRDYLRGNHRYRAPDWGYCQERTA